MFLQIFSCMMFGCFRHIWIYSGYLTSRKTKRREIHCLMPPCSQPLHVLDAPFHRTHIQCSQLRSESRVRALLPPPKSFHLKYKPLFSCTFCQNMEVNVLLSVALYPPYRYQSAKLLYLGDKTRTEDMARFRLATFTLLFL